MGTEVNWDGAIEVIERDGWAQQSWGAGEGEPACLFGACFRGSGVFAGNIEKRTPIHRAAAPVMAEIIREQFPERVRPGKDVTDGEIVFDFNDDLRTTKEEALLVLEKARAH